MAFHSTAASMPAITAPHAIMSQLVFVTTDTFLSLEGCNTFQAGKKKYSQFLMACMVHITLAVLTEMPS